MRRRRIFSLAAGMLALVVFRGASVTSAAALPPLLDRYVNQYVQLDAAAHERLLAGQPVTKLLDADPSKEVAIFGAVWIDAPIARYVAAIKAAAARTVSAASPVASSAARCVARARKARPRCSG